MINPRLLQDVPLRTISLEQHRDAVTARVRALRDLKMPLLRYQIELRLLTGVLLDDTLEFTPGTVWGDISGALGAWLPDEELTPQLQEKCPDIRLAVSTYLAVYGSLTELALGYKPAKPDDVSDKYAPGHYSDQFHQPRLEELMVWLEALLSGYSLRDDAIVTGSKRLHTVMQRHFAGQWLINPMALGSALMTQPEFSRLLSFGKVGDKDELLGIRLVVWALERAIAEYDSEGSSGDEIIERTANIMFFWMLLKGICWDIAYNNGNAWGLAKDAVLQDRIETLLRRGLAVCSSAQKLQEHLPGHAQLGWGSVFADNSPGYRAVEAYTEEIIKQLRVRYAHIIKEQEELRMLNKLYS